MSAPTETMFSPAHSRCCLSSGTSAGPLPKHNGVSWRGNSCMKDGLSDSTVRRSLVGGFYDAGDAIKFNYPMAWSMTMLSWSVIEYRAKYEAIGELDHIKELIKWGTDYILKTFNSSADTIDRIVAQVGSHRSSCLMADLLCPKKLVIRSTKPLTTT